KLLARSATGQKLTAYTTLIRGPRRSGDDCGPDQVHVVLLDNGRSGILAGETAEILGCIRCGACLNACPVYKNIGGHAYGDGYRAAMAAMRRVLRRRATNGWIARAPGMAAGWTRFRDLKAPAARTFEAQWRARAAAGRSS